MALVYIIPTIHFEPSKDGNLFKRRTNQLNLCRPQSLFLPRFRSISCVFIILYQVHMSVLLWNTLPSTVLVQSCMYVTISSHFPTVYIIMLEGCHHRMLNNDVIIIGSCYIQYMKYYSSCTCVPTSKMFCNSWKGFWIGLYISSYLVLQAASFSNYLIVLIKLELTVL